MDYSSIMQFLKDKIWPIFSMPIKWTGYDSKANTESTKLADRGSDRIDTNEKDKSTDKDGDLSARNGG